MYLDVSKITTHNVPINIVLGGRGCGKSYGILKYSIKKFIKNNEKFIYLRRYETELKATENLFAHYQNDDFLKDYLLEKKGRYIYCCNKNKCFIDGKFEKKNFYQEKNICALCIPLSKSSQLKSNSFEEYKRVIFEEFLIENKLQHYIKNELNLFLSLLNTVFRDRKIECYMLANNTSSINPYFIGFDIKLKNQEITKIKRKNKYMFLVYQHNDEEHYNHYEKTDIGLLMLNTEYGEHALKNKSLLDNNSFISQKTETSNFSFALQYNNVVIGFWLDINKCKLFANEKVPKNANVYATTIDDMKPNIYLIKNMKNNLYLKILREAFEYGYLYYQNAKIKNYTHAILKLINYY